MLICSYAVRNQACVLLETQYGAMSVHDDQGNSTAFVTTGVDGATVERIGPPPTGKGVLGISLREGQRLRLSQISQNPRSCGLPDGHPPMRSLLAVPVICRGPSVGKLYLPEKHDGGDFTAEDEDALARFATQAAIAVDNAHLHVQARSLAVVRERLNIAHELHDGHAQILAFVNTKAQAVRAYIDRGNTDESSVLATTVCSHRKALPPRGHRPTLAKACLNACSRSKTTSCSSRYPSMT